MAAATTSTLSVVIPAFDESTRLREPLREVGEYLAAQPYPAEIVVVDDGSRDDTARVAREVAEKLRVPVEVVRYAENRGKGFALKVGFARARGERILFSDADLSTPIEECARLLEQLERGYDVVIGSRWLRGARVEVYQPWYRVLLGVVFTLLVRLLAAPVTDATCGFKVFRGDAGRALFARARVPGWSFDAEILCLARHLGFRIAEVPVAWRDVRGSKVSIARDVLGSLRGLVQIRSNLLRGVYEQPAPVEAELEVWRNREAGGP